MKETLYVTTAIDYVNGRPHLGHAYEKTAADTIVRWFRLRGYDVRFLIGTDEHGGKIQKAAEDAGLPPKAYVDTLVPEFLRAWELLDVVPDRFIRTTDPDHEAAAIRMLERIRDAGFLEERDYEGWYCDGCEAFKLDRELVDGKCPDHPTRTPRWLKEHNLFFRLSAFRGRLLAHLAAVPDFVQPVSRRNEVLAMLDDLPDMSISRSVDAVSWGIPIPFRPGSVVYVWFEALINYATGAGFPSDDAAFVRWFPSALHVIGKDVVRFHCVLWPAMLMAAGLPLPRRVYAHGWVLDTGAKMSKSTGTGADPVVLAETFGPDPLRFYLLHDVVWGKDGEFSSARLAENYNAFLANGLGNLLSRAVSMAQKYFGAVPPASGDDPLRARTEAHTREAITAWDELRLTDAVQAAYRIVRDGNEQIQAREPWKMAKDAARRDELAAFLYAVLESLRIAGVLLSPALPRKAPDLLAALGTALGADFDTNVRWGGLRPGTALRGGAPLFPRYETPAP